MELLAFYADRTRRPAASVRAADTLPTFGAPRPVVRQLSQALVAALKSHTFDERAAVVDCLWAAEFLEPRLLAIDLLADAPWAQAAAVCERLSAATQTRTLHRALAERGLAGWRAETFSSTLGSVRRWLTAEDLGLQRLALGLLQQQVAEVDQRALPSLFGVLTGVAAQLGGESSRAVRQVLRVLAERNQAETARFLLDELRRNNRRPAYQALVHDLLPAFVDPFRQELALALSVI